MRKSLMFIFLIVVLVLASCSAHEGDEPGKPQTTSQNFVENEIAISSLNLTEEERIFVENLQARGVLKVASRAVPSVYNEKNGEIVGFNYSTIKRFTDVLGLELEVKLVDNIEEFFKYEGLVKEAVQTDESISYKPDLFNEVDVYVDTLTKVPWRERLMDFIGFTPIRELVIHKKGVDIDTVSDLDGKTVAVQSISSYMSTVDQLVKTHGFQFKYVYTDTISGALDAVSSGEADFTIMDSNRAFLEAKANENFEVSIPITDVKFVGWAVAKDNPVLKSVLEKYIERMIDEGDINDLWLEDFDISFYEYYTLILKDTDVLSAMNLNADEQAYINKIKERGYINFAMQNNVIGYQVGSETQTGYNYLLARDFADMIDVEMQLTLVDQFTKYFWKDGETPDQVKTNPDYTYVPDLFETVDVYADNLTHVPWRQQILNQIEGVPVSVVFVQSVDINLNDIRDLDGLTIAINRDTSHELVLENIEKTYNIKMEVYEVFNDTESIEVVAEGLADVTISDSDLGFLYLQDFEGVKIELQASESDFVGWAVKKDDVLLASILEKYIKAMKENGKFDEYWELCYGVSYPEYMRLMTE